MFGNLTKLSPNESLYVLNIRQFQKLWFGIKRGFLGCFDF